MCSSAASSAWSAGWPGTLAGAILWLQCAAGRPAADGHQHSALRLGGSGGHLHRDPRPLRQAGRQPLRQRLDGRTGRLKRLRRAGLAGRCRSSSASSPALPRRCWSNCFELALSIDDPSGAISVHAAAGLWGLLAAGIFAPRPGQLVAQAGRHRHAARRVSAAGLSALLAAQPRSALQGGPGRRAHRHGPARTRRRRLSGVRDSPRRFVPVGTGAMMAGRRIGTRRMT